MVASWLSLIPRILSLLTSLMEIARSHRERGVGWAEAAAFSLKAAQEDIVRAKQAREDQRRADALSGDPRLHDDGFRRK